MNQPNSKEHVAASDVASYAVIHADSYAKPEDLSAAATGILIEAIHILNPALDRERLVRLILGENE